LSKLIRQEAPPAAALPGAEHSWATFYVIKQAGKTRTLGFTGLVWFCFYKLWFTEELGRHLCHFTALHCIKLTAVSNRKWPRHKSCYAWKLSDTKAQKLVSTVSWLFVDRSRTRSEGGGFGYTLVWRSHLKAFEHQTNKSDFWTILLYLKHQSWNSVQKKSTLPRPPPLRLILTPHNFRT
jgi:hypothetical protein